MKRPLSRFQRFVGVPLGVLWLGVIAVMAIPVILYMSALYYVHPGARAIAAGRRDAQGASRDEA